VELVKLLCTHGASPNIYSRQRFPALHFACSKFSDPNSKEPAIPQILIDAGADVNMKTSIESLHCTIGSTALHLTAEASNFITAATLVSNAVDVNVVNSLGKTPLHLACCNKYWLAVQDDFNIVDPDEDSKSMAADISSQTIKILLDAGADCFAKDIHGATPLHYCAKAGNLRTTASLLLYSGTRLLFASDHSEQLPVHYAARWAGSPDVLHVVSAYCESGDPLRDKYCHIIGPLTSRKSHRTPDFSSAGLGPDRSDDPLHEAPGLARKSDTEIKSISWTHPDSFMLTTDLSLFTKPDSSMKSALEYAADNPSLELYLQQKTTPLHIGASKKIPRSQKQRQRLMSVEILCKQLPRWSKMIQARLSASQYHGIFWLLGLIVALLVFDDASNLIAVIPVLLGWSWRR
jgi:ankyrin repeat protein